MMSSYRKPYIHTHTHINPAAHTGMHPSIQAHTNKTHTITHAERYIHIYTQSRLAG